MNAPADDTPDAFVLTPPKRRVWPSALLGLVVSAAALVTLGSAALYFGGVLERVDGVGDLSKLDTEIRMLTFYGALGLLFGVRFLNRAFARRKERRHPPTLTFGDSLVRLPILGTGRVLEVTDDDVTALEVRRFRSRRGPRTVLVVGTSRRPVVLPASAFADGEAFKTCAQKLQKRLASGPRGPARVALLEARARRSARLGARGIPVTKTVVSALAIVFMLEMWVGLSLESLLWMGANARLLVADGDFFRLTSANVMHGSLVHLLLNGVSIVFLGVIIEKLWGSAKTIVVMTLSAWAGAALSAWWGEAALSVGSSTTVFGLLGAYGIIHARTRGELPVGFGQPLRWWALILGLNLGLPLLVPAIDVAAHLGGAVVGVALGLVFPPALDGPVDDGRLIRVLAVVCATIFVGGVGRAAGVALSSPRDEAAARFLEAATRGYTETETLAHVDVVGAMVWSATNRPDASPRYRRAAAAVAALR